MPKQLKPLTNVEIAGAKPRSTDYELRDGEGLYLLVKTSGRKARHFEYYHPSPKAHQNQPWPLPGRYTGHGSRNSHEIQTTALAGHRSPSTLSRNSRRKRIQNECTLEKVAEQWLKEKKRTSDLSEDHAKDIWRSLEMHVFPLWVVRPSLRSARRCSRNTLHRWKNRASSKHCGELSHGSMKSSASPFPKSSSSSIQLTTRRPLQETEKQNMPALHPSELGRLMLALQNASIRKETRCLIEWELLTWVRPGEAVSARWCDIDMKKRNGVS